jgi:hypothetical protein
VQHYRSSVSLMNTLSACSSPLGASNLTYHPIVLKTFHRSTEVAGKRRRIDTVWCVVVLTFTLTWLSFRDFVLSCIATTRGLILRAYTDQNRRLVSCWKCETANAARPGAASVVSAEQVTRPLQSTLVVAADSNRATNRTWTYPTRCNK